MSAKSPIISDNSDIFETPSPSNPAEKAESIMPDASYINDQDLDILTSSSSTPFSPEPLADDGSPNHHFENNSTPKDTPEPLPTHHSSALLAPQRSPYMEIKMSPNDDTPYDISLNPSPPNNSRIEQAIDPEFGLELAAAAQAGDPIRLTSLLYHPSLPSVLNVTHPSFGLPPLSLAAYSGSSECIRLLLMAGAAPNLHAGALGATPIHIAAAEGHTDAIYMLLRGGARANLIDDSNCSAISRAAAAHKPSAVLALLAQLAEETMEAHLSPAELVLIAWFTPGVLPSAIAALGGGIRLLFTIPDQSDTGFSLIPAHVGNLSAASALFCLNEVEPKNALLVLRSVATAMAAHGIVSVSSVDASLSELALDPRFGVMGRSNLTLSAEMNARSPLAACLSVCDGRRISAALPELMRWSAKGRHNREDSQEYYHKMAATSLLLIAGEREGKIDSLVDAADPDHGSTPLQLAALYGNPATVLLLLRQGADTTIQDAYGRTATDLARLRLDAYFERLDKAQKGEQEDQSEELDSDSNLGDHPVESDDSPAPPCEPDVEQEEQTCDSDRTPILPKNPKESKPRTKDGARKRRQRPFERRLAAARAKGPLPLIIRNGDDPEGVMASLHFIRWTQSLMVRLNTFKPFGVQTYALYWFFLLSIMIMVHFEIFDKHQSPPTGEKIIRWLAYSTSSLVFILLIWVRMSNPGYLPAKTRAEVSVIINTSEEAKNNSETAPEREDDDEPNLFIADGDFEKPPLLVKELDTILDGCPTCISKPVPRSKHSRFSNRCIGGFDHYCPWVYQDIGAGNHRIFVALLSLSTFVGVLLFFWVYRQVFFFPEEIGLTGINENHRETWSNLFSDRPILLYLVFMLPILAIYLVFLEIAQLSGISNNLTQNEWINMERYPEFKRNGAPFNPYSEGSMWKNWKSFWSGQRKAQCMGRIQREAPGCSMKACSCERGNTETEKHNDMQTYQSPTIDLV